jgi:hypothetical protein
MNMRDDKLIIGKGIEERYCTGTIIDKMKVDSLVKPHGFLDMDCKNFIREHGVQTEFFHCYRGMISRIFMELEKPWKALGEDRKKSPGLPTLAGNTNGQSQ